MNPDQISDDESDHPRVRRRKNPLLRIAVWTAATLTLIAGLACVAISILVNTSRGHRYLLGLARRKASDALGVRVQIQNLTLHLGSLSADLYGARISGAAPYTNPPLLEVDHIAVGVRIVSLLHRRWYLDNVQIDHPVAWVVQGKNGKSNLPVFKSGGANHTDIFQLGIRRFAISRGEVYLNSHPHKLSADLHHLAFSSTYNSLLRRYSGDLSYSQATLAFGGYRPLRHDLNVEFAATPGMFTVYHARVSAGASGATFSGTVKSYRNPIVQAQYDALLDGTEAAEILDETAVPSGAMRLSGSIHYQQSGNQSPLQSLAISGAATSGNLSLNTAAIHTRVADLSAHYSLANGNATVHDLHARILGGAVTANGTMEALGERTNSNFHLDLRNLSLSQAMQALGNSSSKQNISLEGSADATATVSWGRTINNLTARVDLGLNGQAVRHGPSSSKPIFESTTAGGGKDGDVTVPVQGSLHALYAKVTEELTLNHSDLHTPQSHVSLNGTISRRSRLGVDLKINDLSEVATLADLFLPRETGQAGIDLTGSASFDGFVSGSLAAPEISGQLEAKNIGYRNTNWKLLQTGIDVSPDHANLKGFHLEGMDHARVMGSAEVHLNDWKFASQSPVSVSLNASGLNAATIATLVRRQVPISGILNVQAQLRGEATSPRGNSVITLSKATAFGEPISQAKVDFRGSNKGLEANLSVQLPAGTLQGQATADPRDRSFTARLDSSGLDLGKLHVVETRGIAAKGVLEVHAQGHGTFDNPEANATFEIPKLSIGGQSILQTRVEVNTANHVANASLVSSVAGASLHGAGRLNLNGDEQVDASLDSQTIPLAALLAAYEPEQGPGISGQAEIHASVHGPLKDRRRLQVHIALPVLRVAYGKVQLAASAIQADLQNGTATIRPLTIRGTDTNLNVQAALPIGHQAAASLEVQGAVGLEILQIFDPELQASGQVKVNVDSHTADLGRLLTGEIDILNANLSTNSSPAGLQHANGVLRMDNGHFEITKFDGAVGGGTVTAQGSVDLRPSVRFDLGATVQGARILYPQGVREMMDANVRLTGSEKHAVLSGSVKLADMSFTPGFDLTAVVNHFSSAVEAPATQGFAQNLQLNIAVNSAGNANLVSRTLSVDGSANLQIRGTASQPVILGRINLSSGDVILHGDRFVLTGGTIEFINPTMTQPVLNVSMSTTIQEYNIKLLFRGPADQMQTQYSSDPSLPQADIINLLAFGQTTEASAINATPMNQQAESLVASQVASQVTSRISRAAGISELSISPVLAGGTAAGPPGADLTIQQRVTGNLFVTFSTNVATTQGQIIQGQYKVSPRVTISATRDENGGFAVDTLIKKSW